MFKSIVLLATCAVAANAYVSHQTLEKVNSRFAMALTSNQAIREKHNLRTLKSSNPFLQQDGSFTDGIDFSDIWGCARGFAKGLQFSSAKEGACYVSLDEFINASDNLSELLLKAYQPWVWADIMQIAQNNMDYFAAINSNCDFQKLIKTLTTDASTLIPAMIARVGGGFIMEIPDRYLKMKNAKSCSDLSFQIAKVFSLICDYYI
jgi:hypothetical protein